MSKNLSFKNFLKEQESYFSAMKDNLGINIDDYKVDPKVASFFSLGSKMVNIGPYKIMDFKKNDNGQITHVLVKQINDPKIVNIKYINDKKVNNDGGNETFLISIDDLQKLLLQGQDQPQQSSDMGGLGGIA